MFSHEIWFNPCASYLHFSDPSDPVSPKDPTRVPFSPKHPDNKEPYNPNDVLEKSSKNYSKYRDREVIEGRIYRNNLAFGAHDCSPISEQIVLS